MPESLDQANKEIMEAVGPGILRQLGRQFESLQEAISMNPSDGEITEVLGEEATEKEYAAYRRGHQSGWYKGALMLGCASLAALSVLLLATSGEVRKTVGERSRRSLSETS